jgi:DNA-binding transcriptional LysR family regulator
MENLRSLEIFISVAEALSFAAAARRLGLSTSATGKAVGSLEARLGVRLLNRTTRRVSLTPEGELLYSRALRMQEDWRDTEALLSGSSARPQGALRISLPAIGYRLLLPHLQAFTHRYPDIRLDLDCDDRIRDVVADGFDLAIRSGVLPDSTLLSRKLTAFKFSLCASPAYLAQHGTPSSVDDLVAHRTIRFRRTDADVLQSWCLCSGVARDIERHAPPFICTNMEAVRLAAIAGLGIAWSPDFLIADAIASGDLVDVLPSETTEGVFWVVWPSGRHVTPRLRAFLDFPMWAS